MAVSVVVTVGCVADGTVIANDDHAAACDQDTTAVNGPAVNTTVAYDEPLASFTSSTLDVAVGESVHFTSISLYADIYFIYLHDIN